jgi:class 3 adenylate cyclase/DNA-binding SARP family transcriptional activator/tetratricopeptide (TPR) repeat protein
MPEEEFGSPFEPAIAARATLLGAFSISSGSHTAGPWPRPSAKRLCELVLVSQGRRVTRDLACEALFPDLGPDKAARALVKALSMARGVLLGLGKPGAGLIQADRVHIWASPEPVLDIDLERHEKSLRSALAMAPGQSRDDRLLGALEEDDKELLADQPYSDWAIRPRERLEALRQQARLCLARDRAGGTGRANGESVVEAWESCLLHDPACEEAAGGLIRAYSAHGQHQLVARTYELCRATLDELGLRPSPALEEIHTNATFGRGPDRRLLTVPHPPAGALSWPATAREERKTVSVLFAGVTPTKGDNGQDPEDLHKVVAESLAMVINEVEGLGGTVISVSGTGLQALFGAPETHEDDPERAVRAAFRAMSAQSAASSPICLRIGVETGPVVVGPIRAGARNDYGAVGAVVAAAAALQSLARPASVLVGPATRAVTERLFDWGPCEQVVVPAETKPLAASYLEQPKARSPRRQPRLGGRGPVVGRKAELSVLATALQDLGAGRGSLVLVVGEPGLGKTRLVQECRKRFMASAEARSGGSPLWLEGRCASYAATTPYSLYQHLLAGWAGVAPDQEQTVVARALEQALRAAMGGGEDLWPILARMMGLSTAPGLARMTPQELQRETFAAVRSVVARLISFGPTVLALEDLHWADPTSLRLTEDLATLASEGPLLVLATTRPDARAELAGFESKGAREATISQHRVELGPLTKDAERDLARMLVGDDAGQDVLDNMLRGVEGNPLVLEERYFSMVETGALVRDEGRWRVAPSVGPPVPEVLERLVRSRADRLTPAAQEVLRTASVLGQELGLPLLSALCPEGDQLCAALEELSGAGLLQEVPNAPEPTYRFRHALIQEATYGGMLRPERRQLHGRAAWALEGLSPGRLAEVAPVLGRHYAAAGEPERAVHYFELAGDNAVEAFANDEAVTSFRAGMAVADQQGPSNEAMARTAVALRAKLAQVLWHTGRASEAREVLGEAIRLAGPGDPVQRARLKTLLGRVESDERLFDTSLATLDAAQELIGEKPSSQDEAVVDQWLELMLHGRANLLLHRQEPEQAMAALSAARPVVEATGAPDRRQVFYWLVSWQRALQNRYCMDREILANARRAVAIATENACDPTEIAWRACGLGLWLTLHGELVDAQEQLESSLAVAERSGNTTLRAASMVYLAQTAQRRHDAEAVRSLAPHAATASEVAGIAQLQAWATACLVWLAWQDQEPSKVAVLAEGTEDLLRTAVGGFMFWKWVYLWPVVAMHLCEGKVAEAVAAGLQMLEPSQQRLPDELESLLEAAVTAWTSENADLAGRELARALEVAHDLDFF